MSMENADSMEKTQVAAIDREKSKKYDVNNEEVAMVKNTNLRDLWSDINRYLSIIFLLVIILLGVGFFIAYRHVNNKLDEFYHEKTNFESNEQTGRMDENHQRLLNHVTKLEEDFPKLKGITNKLREDIDNIQAHQRAILISLNAANSSSMIEDSVAQLKIVIQLLEHNLERSNNEINHLKNNVVLREEFETKHNTSNNWEDLIRSLNFSIMRMNNTIQKQEIKLDQLNREIFITKNYVEFSKEYIDKRINAVRNWIVNELKY